MRNADFAMSQAKAAGRGQYALYDEDTNAVVQGRIALEADLRVALARARLTLACQPQAFTLLVVSRLSKCHSA